MQGENRRDGGLYGVDADLEQYFCAAARRLSQIRVLQGDIMAYRTGPSSVSDGGGGEQSTRPELCTEEARSGVAALQAHRSVTVT